MGALALAWTIALAVLALAGVGIRSLLALTTRRLRFAYAVTHELRTPLTTFQLYTDMLADGLVPEESKQEYLDSLKRESQRLSRLVQGVLEYARLENQKAKLNPIQTDAPAVIQKIAETLTARCEDSEVKSTAENMVPNGCMFRTDVDLVTQIAGVLIDNAVRHAKQSDDPSVCVQLSAHDNRLEIDVTDSGPGIARADTRRVFKPFRRGKTAEVDAHRGIGLGLSLAQSWARLLGGRLYLVARNDPKLGGAHFRLSVPQNI